MKTKVKKVLPDRLDEYNSWRLWQIIIPYVHVEGKPSIEKSIYTFSNNGVVKFYPWGSVEMALEKAIKAIAKKSEILHSLNKELLVVNVKVFCFIAGVRHRNQNKSDDLDLAKLLKKKLLERYN